MEFNKSDTALVVIDPQNDVLSETGVSWGLVGESIKENNTVENLERLFRAAKDGGFGVFISPHYLYPADQGWGFGGAVERMMLEGKEFFRPDPLSLDGFTGSGADWLDRYKPYIEDGKTVVVSTHKVWGPQTNDLVLQLRKRRVNKVVLAGMLANLCVESHLRELIEQGFEVAVVKDATAAPRHPELGDGYKAAVVNYNFIANAVLTTDEAVSRDAVGRNDRFGSDSTPEIRVMPSDLAGKLLGVLDQLSGGVHPGFRPVHAKDVMFSGTFVPSPDAAELTRAPHASRPSTPVTVRFSASSGIPAVADNASEGSSPQGMATRFHLASTSIQTSSPTRSTDCAFRCRRDLVSIAGLLHFLCVGRRHRNIEHAIGCFGRSDSRSDRCAAKKDVQTRQTSRKSVGRDDR